MCETPAGCPIEDLATDPVLEELVAHFVKQRAVFEMTKDPETYRRLCVDMDFYLYPDFHYAVEALYLTWMNQTKEKLQNSMRNRTRKQ